MVRWMIDLGWLCILVLLFWHFLQIRKALVHAQSWLKVKGHVTHCEWQTLGHRVWPKIQYTYRVHNTDITGEYLFLDTSHNNPSSKYARLIAYKAAMAFKEGSEIEIYYNPNQPQQSALDVTIPKKVHVILLLLGLLVSAQLGYLGFRVYSHPPSFLVSLLH